MRNLTEQNLTDAVLAKLEGAVLQAMRDPVVRKKIEDLDIEVLDMDSCATKKWLEDDVKRLSAVIKQAGLDKQVK